jgi:hypothetical protein
MLPPGLRYDKTSHMPKRGVPIGVPNAALKRFCETCEVGLCMTKDKNCFNEYHKK